MEAPHGRGWITPLPPPEPDGSGRESGRAPRPWLPATLAVSGLILFAFWLAVSPTDPGTNNVGAGASAPLTLAPLSARDLPTTTIPTIPKTPRPAGLNEMLPWLEGSLVVFSNTDGTARMSLWTGSSVSPLAYPLSGSRLLDVRPEPESLDQLAYETAGTVRALYIGGWQTQEPIFVGSQGFAWDPLGSGTLAWIGTDQVTGVTSLYSKRLAGPTKLRSEVPTGSFLIEWTLNGLVVAETLGPSVNTLDPATGERIRVAPVITVLLRPDGSVVATAAAKPIKVSRSGTVVAAGTAGIFEAIGLEPDVDLVPPDELIILDTSAAGDASDGFVVRQIPIREALADGESIFSADENWSISPDGAWAGRIVNWATSTSLVVQSLESLSVRVVPLRTDFPLTTVGFTADGNRFFAASPEGDELIAIGWTNGAQYVVPFDGIVTLNGIFVRP